MLKRDANEQKALNIINYFLFGQSTNIHQGRRRRRKKGAKDSGNQQEIVSYCCFYFFTIIILMPGQAEMRINLSRKSLIKKAESACSDCGKS